MNHTKALAATLALLLLAGSVAPHAAPSEHGGINQAGIDLGGTHEPRSTMKQSESSHTRETA